MININTESFEIENETDINLKPGFLNKINQTDIVLVRVMKWKKKRHTLTILEMERMFNQLTILGRNLGQ